MRKAGKRAQATPKKSSRQPCSQSAAQGTQAEEEVQGLAQRLEQQSRIFDTTLLPITDFAYTFDREGRFIYVNQSLLDLWDLKLKDAAGKTLYDLNYPDDLVAWLQRQIQQVSTPDKA